MAGEALNVFISYSHQDEGLKDELVNYHLKRLQWDGKINTWQDRDIAAGAEWDEEIRHNLDKADIILMLVTRHFLASEYCYGKEMMRAIERHEQGTARVISVILSPCVWEDTPFQKLQVLPKDCKPVTLWENREEAFVDVELGIRRVVDSLHAERQPAEVMERLQLAEERQRQIEAERQRQQPEAETQLERKKQATEQLRRQQEAERLQRETEAERQRNQQIAKNNNDTTNPTNKDNAITVKIFIFFLIVSTSTFYLIIRPLSQGSTIIPNFTPQKQNLKDTEN